MDRASQLSDHQFLACILEFSPPSWRTRVAEKAQAFLFLFSSLAYPFYIYGSNNQGRAANSSTSIPLQSFRPRSLPTSCPDPTRCFSGISNSAGPEIKPIMFSVPWFLLVYFLFSLMSIPTHSRALERVLNSKESKPVNLLGEAHWLKPSTLARHHSNYLYELFYDRRSCRNRELISLHQPEEFGKSQKETPPVWPRPRILLSRIHFGWTRRAPPGRTLSQNDWLRATLRS